MRRYVTIAILFLALSASSQIKETVLRMDTRTTPFTEKYYPKQLVRIADSVHIFALTHATLAGQSMKTVFDSGWCKLVDWTSLAFAGGPVTTVPYVGRNIASSDALDWLRQAFYSFVPAEIGLSSNQLKQVGTTSQCAVTTHITPYSETVFVSGHLDKTSTPSIPNLLTWTTSTQNQTATVTFAPTKGQPSSLRADYLAYETVGNNGSPATKTSNQVSLTSCYPYMYGMSASDLSSGTGLYAAMAKDVKTCSSSTTVRYNSPTESKYAYFAFPSSCANQVYSILDQNLYEWINAFTRHDSVLVSSSGLNGTNWVGEPYTVYVSKNKFFTTGQGWDFQFKQ